MRAPSTGSPGGAHVMQCLLNQAARGFAPTGVLNAAQRAALLSDAADRSGDAAAMRRAEILEVQTLSLHARL